MAPLEVAAIDLNIKAPSWRKMWIHEYMPRDTTEVKGQDAAICSIREHIKGISGKKKKGILAYGPTGCGKTSAVHAIAGEANAELIEINASDYRTQSAIEEKIGRAAGQRSLFSETKIILVDEVDGLSGTKDRGGVPAIAKMIEKSAYPIILTVNDPYDQRLSALRKKCELVEFRTLNYLTVHSVLKRLCESEGVEYDETALKGLARRSGGDLRAAINDLEMSVGDGRFTKHELDLLSDRNQVDKIHNALMKVFKTTDTEVSRSAFDNVNEDIDQVMLWIDENLPKEYTRPEDLARAYDMISRADVFKGRIRRWQHWRFLVYVYASISAGVSVSKDEKYKGFTKYSPTTRILALWRAKMKYGKRRSIAEKIAQATHTSSRRVISDSLPYLHEAFRKKGVQELADELDLDKDEIAWLSKE